MQLTMRIMPLIMAANFTGPQDLERSIAHIRDGEVRFSFAARPGVCGDGADVIIADRKRYVWPGTETVGDFPRTRCSSGPVRVSIERSNGSTVGIRTFVGGNWRPYGPVTFELGAVTATEAMDYLLGLASTESARIATAAVMPASLAQSRQLVPRLKALAADATRPTDVRVKAINWIGQAGGADAVPFLDALARNSSVPHSIRSRALKAVWEAGGEGALSSFVHSGAPVNLRTEAVGWLGQIKSQSSAEFLRGLIRNGVAPTDIRAKAILSYARMKHGLTNPGFLRDTYPALRSDEERLALLRGVAEQSDVPSVTWLAAFARNPAYPSELRQFADARLREMKR